MPWNIDGAFFFSSWILNLLSLMIPNDHVPLVGRGIAQLVSMSSVSWFLFSLNQTTVSKKATLVYKKDIWSKRSDFNFKYYSIHLMGKGSVLFGSFVVMSLPLVTGRGDYGNAVFWASSIMSTMGYSRVIVLNLYESIAGLGPNNTSASSFRSENHSCSLHHIFFSGAWCSRNPEMH